MSTSIDAIKAYVSGLSESEKQAFAVKYNIDLSNLYSLDSLTAKHLCETLKLQSNNPWDLYGKSKARYEQVTQEYEALAKQHSNVEAQLKEAKAKYDKFVKIYLSQNGGNVSDMTSTQRSSFASKAGYTTELIHNARDLEIAKDVKLSARFQAVSSMQRSIGIG